MFHVILLLDSRSKAVSRLDSSSLASKEIIIIGKLTDITMDMLQDTKTVIVLDGAFSDATMIADLHLFKKLFDLNYLFLLSESENKAVAFELGSVYSCDTSVIDYNLIQASLFNDSAYSVDDSKCPSSKIYAQTVCDSSTIASQSEKQLASDYLGSLCREEELVKRLKQREDELSLIAIQLASAVEDNNKWRDGCAELFNRIVAHNESLERYETVLSQDIYTKINLHDYPNRPLIIYFKEFTEFIGENSFIETLVDALRYQTRRSVKVLQLFDGSGDRRIRLLPTYYHRLHNYYQTLEVIEQNYLCKSGEYVNLLDKLLQNKYGLDVLIIIDRKDHDDVVLTGSFPQFNLCRLPIQGKTFGLAPETTIVNTKASNYHSWVPVNVSDLSAEDKFLKLSSREVIQYVLRACEKFSNSL